MKNFLTGLMLLYGGVAVQAQLNGVLVLKRNQTTIRRYFENRGISFITQENESVEGVVERVVKDTLYLRFYDIRQMANQWGFPTMDTLRELPLAYAFDDIKTVIRERTEFNYETDGGLLMVAGGGLILLGVINGRYAHEQVKDWFSGGNIWTALGLAAFGFWFMHLRYKHYRLGKKFHLEYYGFPSPKG